MNFHGKRVGVFKEGRRVDSGRRDETGRKIGRSAAMSTDFLSAES